MSDHSELVEALQRLAPMCLGLTVCDRNGSWWVDQAAAALTAQAEEIERLTRERVDKARAWDAVAERNERGVERAERLLAEIERLREALDETERERRLLDETCRYITAEKIKAQEAERERCAKVAETLDEGRRQDAVFRHAMNIAAAIRGGSDASD